jgi:hypothetical protein
MLHKDSRTIHLRPRNDLIEHEFDDDCVCGPKVTPTSANDGGMAWISEHQALDGRNVPKRKVPEAPA